jgi:hypothetical protein
MRNNFEDLDNVRWTDLTTVVANLILLARFWG